MQLLSSSFADGQAIPVEHTCEGGDASPALRWGDVPKTAQTLVLIVDDPDAPDPQAPKTTWVHWLLFNIPVSATELVARIKPAKLPPGTGQGKNDWGSTGYRGPCPPIGRHRYFHKLYALDTNLAGLTAPTKAQLEAAMRGHIIAQATLMGTYARTTR